MRDSSLISQRLIDRHPIGRRSLLATAGGVAAAMLASALPARGATFPTVKLRLLETSDLHGCIDDYDYFHDRPDATVGLAKIATLVDVARGEAANTLLLDDGDLLQGNPLADYVALRQGLPQGAIHPMFRAMNLMGYDAATLGNHEFNYGLPFLERALQGAAFPYVSANVARSDGSPLVPPWTVLERDLVAEDGSRQRVRIGIIGFLPPQILVWDRARLAGRVTTTDIVEAATRHLPALRARCDIVVALCHSGIATAPRQGGDENAAFYLAALPGIDVVLTGHSHRVFPGPDYARRAGVDPVRGTLHGIPAVMPGFWGSHLGVVDLTLRRRDGKWAVAASHSAARPIYRREGGKPVALVSAKPAIVAAVAEEHRATIAYMGEPIGRLTAPLTSYFALVADDPSVEIVNRAQLWYAKPLLAGTPHEALPLLSAAAPFRAGTFGGPDAATDIPAGPIARRHVADLYVYPNTLQAVLVTGAIVQEWLERAAGVFFEIDPADRQVQDLVNPRVPAYNFDVIEGVTYRIDVTQPARYDSAGRVVEPDARRIQNLRYDGKPIDPAQPFVVVTNNFRAAGGGRFPGLDGTSVILDAPDTNRDVLARYIAEQGTITPTVSGTWRLTANGATPTVSFEASLAAQAHLAAHPGIRMAGDLGNGFGRFEMPID
jgi:2',3'-cyclic-nucleotide 2'-phosphodiesterase/3'-nucleotidase